MAFNRGDVVLIPFPYTNLSAAKTRPAVVVSSSTYHATRPELLLAYISSQLSQATPPLDYILADWRGAGLLRPSFVRPKIAAIEPTLVVYQTGTLSSVDLEAVDRSLRQAMALTAIALPDVIAEIDLQKQPSVLVQQLAEASVAALVAMAAVGAPGVDLNRLTQLLNQSGA